jgi:hypothetical protein
VKEKPTLSLLYERRERKAKGSDCLLINIAMNERYDAFLESGRRRSRFIFPLVKGGYRGN